MFKFCCVANGWVSGCLAQGKSSSAVNECLKTHSDGGEPWVAQVISFSSGPGSAERCEEGHLLPLNRCAQLRSRGQLGVSRLGTQLWAGLGSWGAVQWWMYADTAGRWEAPTWTTSDLSVGCEQVGPGCLMWTCWCLPRNQSFCTFASAGAWISFCLLYVDACCH